MQTTEFMTTAAVAERLRRSKRTIHRMADRGELPAAHRLDGKTGALLFSRQVVEMYAQTQKKPDK